MSLNSRILVLVDPSQEKQHALRRARFNAKRRGEKPHLTVFMAVDHELHKYMKKQKPIMYRDPEWITETLNPLTEVGLEHELCISWDDEWSEAVLGEIKRSQPDLVMVPVYEDESGNRIITDEIWRLLRKSKVNVSLLHVTQHLNEERKVILAAIKSQDPKYSSRNKRILDEGKYLADLYGAELHVANAYQDQMNFPDKAKIMKLSGLPSDRVHLIFDKPDEGIAKVAKRINAEITLISPARRTGFAATLRGATINKLISKIESDVLAIA